MTSIQLNVRVIEDSISSALADIGRRLDAASRRQMMAEVGREFVAITKDNFGASGPHRPAYWVSLTPKYQRRIKYYGPPLLIGKGGASGRLMNSIQVGYVQADSVEVETDVEYAAVHQFGGGNNIPARPYFPVERSNVSGEYELTDYAQIRLNQVIARHLGLAYP